MEDCISCDEVVELLSDYYDGELSQEKHSQIKNHLAHCLKCAQKLEELEKLTSLIKSSENNLYSSLNDDKISQKVLERLQNPENISCNEVLKELSAYYDDEVDIKLHYSIDRHLKHCSECNNAFIHLEKTGELIRKSGINQLHKANEHNIYEKISPKLKNTDICNYVNENLSAYIDRELSKKEIIKISEHLMYCQYCRKDYESLKDTCRQIKDYFYKFDNSNDSHSAVDAGMVIEQIKKQDKYLYLIGSSAALVCLVALTWFSINFIENNWIRQTFYKQQIELNKDALYVKSEDYFLKTAYSIPKERIVSIFYENE